MIVKRILGVALFILCLLGLAALYVAGVASVSNLMARRPGGIGDGAPAALPDTRWLAIGETDHFSYYGRCGDSIPQWAFDMHETVLSQVSAVLGISVTGRIRFFKHASQADMYGAIGQRSTGVTQAGEEGVEIHSTRSYHPHEVTHAVIHQQWHPPAFFDEGLATVYGWDWDVPEPDVHAHAYGLLQEERLVSLETILTDWGFRRYRTYPAYSAAGSFVKYLMETHEQESIRSLLRLERYSRREEIERAFVRAYGKPIYAIELEWRDALASGSFAPVPTESQANASQAELLLSGAALLAGVFLCTSVAIVVGERVFAGLGRVVRGLLRAGPRTHGANVLVTRNGEH